MKGILKAFAIMLCLVLVLSACGNGNKKDAKSDMKSSKTETSDKKGGTLNVALGAQPSGVFSSVLTSEHTDFIVESYFNESLVESNEKRELEPRIVSWKEKKPGKVYEFTMKKGIKWHDGNELTVDDWIFTLNVLANKDYQGNYYQTAEIIEGAEAYHKGEADSISGLKKINDHKLEITFAEEKVNNLDKLFEGSYLISEKYLGKEPIKTLANSEKIRKKPIGYGPFKVKNIVDGEAIELERFDDYWQGKPNLDKINLKVVDSTQIVKAMEKGEIDMTDAAPPEAKEAEDLKSDKVKVLETEGNSYAILGFVLSDYDKATNKTGKDRPKYQDKELRQAMLYAIDRDKWINAFYYGYGKKLNTFVPSSNWISIDNKELNQYEYNPKKAKEMLDKLGYKDKDGDGFREDPDGKKFEINFKHYTSSNPTFEPRSTAIKDFWEKVGLKTKVKMVEFGKFNEDLEKADKNMEVYFRTWVAGSDPDPSDLYHTDRPLNEMRSKLEKSDKLLDDAVNFKKVGTDKEKRKKIYEEWQKYMNETLPALPIVELSDVVLVSDKVRNVDISPGSDAELYKISVEK